jgi:hypothetical protein
MRRYFFTHYFRSIFSVRKVNKKFVNVVVEGDTDNDAVEYAIRPDAGFFFVPGLSLTMSLCL